MNDDKSIDNKMRNNSQVRKITSAKSKKEKRQERKQNERTEKISFRKM